MSPQAKYNTKWLLGVTGAVLAILVTVITSTASITTKFNKNDADHLVLTTVQAHAVTTVEQMSKKVDTVSDNQIQVMTNQEMILEAIKSQ